eukprot:CAMPEP_0177377234 /NCGR_PEP_ID=MMETSP0368-20130122/45661_1 /TAXON_ID=447022 ORGANISM="Scrippsiella hangoei-like, Strain SHHI-4" /NCGR_SAMPLE_ID=MMETSP0368 /ASSEMBLY_ACC=CAM_ASM_000363 /LENGTH=784 /DNA_ID=CAMNT_0018841041 /DNA_START=73 /DNA_END=2424 /DNA_ORIENTATION=+
MLRQALVLCALLAVAAAAPAGPHHNGAALLQTWEKSLDSGRDTPITRVVNLLKEMSKTLGKDMEEDESLYKELACWCNNGKYEKGEAIKASSAKIEELTSTIESLTAKSAELSVNIKELDAQLASDKQALAEATALREKQLAEFHGMESDSVQALENLKAAIEVLSKHQDAPPDSTVAGGAVFKSERDSWSLLQSDNKNLPWSEAHEANRGERTLDNFMRANGFTDSNVDDVIHKPVAPHKFLQATVITDDVIHHPDPVAPSKFLQARVSATSTWSTADVAIVKCAVKSASAFMQSHSNYFPAYTSKSGEIFGVLKQLEEEMQGDLSEEQKIEQARGAAFAQLRAAKTTQIKEAEKMEEQKEDELANTNNALAEAKEDLGEEQKVLGEDQQFVMNLDEMCAKGDSDFEARKQSRLQEMQAVAETIEILMADEARDAMSGTYKSFVQLASSRESSRRHQAAELLRQVAKKSHNPALLMLATSAELDAFTKVKAAIDDMVVMLKKQQEDEVKKNDWCKAEVHDNEMTTAKTEDKKADIEANIGELTSTIKTLEQEISDAHMAIEQAQMDLQRATEDRKAENFEFQKTVSDQTVTIEVLKQALDKLATYYDFLQQSKSSVHKQTPPVPQKEYSKSKGASGVMEMLEKLIHEAADLRKGSQESEGSAQAAYETLIADTNGSVEALQKEITSKSAAKSGAHKDMLAAESDLSDTMKELEGLNKYNSELHAECDYLLKNFDLRQSTRSNEIEALQQAKQILDGASLNEGGRRLAAASPRRWAATRTVEVL